MPDRALRCAVFDLDGTLVDSAPDIHAALDRLMAVKRLPGFARAEVVAMIGDGVRVLLERAYAARGIALDEADLQHFMTDYEANAAVLTRAFDGIPELLDGLRDAGWRADVTPRELSPPAPVPAKPAIETTGEAGAQHAAAAAPPAAEGREALSNTP
jgi:phosphoglycolate phosphatase